jgi:hypothetical protein
MALDYIEQRDSGFYIKGTRVPMDSVVHEFRNGASPESIRQAFIVEKAGSAEFWFSNSAVCSFGKTKSRRVENARS